MIFFEFIDRSRKLPKVYFQVSIVSVEISRVGRMLLAEDIVIMFLILAVPNSKRNWRKLVFWLDEKVG